MTKKPIRKRSKAFPSPTSESQPKPTPQPTKRPIRWDHVFIFFAISIGGTYLAITMRPSRIPEYSYHVVNKYPHDAEAFTQGLVYEDGILWESTGRYGESTMRKVDMESGDVLINTQLPDEYFGEGCVRWKDTLIQLTWKEKKIFVYDLDLKKIAEHDFDDDMWGITTDGKSLIISDGNSVLKFLNPETFEVTRSIVVRDDQRRIGSLNELEYVDGKIFANRWKWDRIYEIDPATGDVESVINLDGLWPANERPADAVLNGIAINTKSGKLLVTGKLCPWIYEIELTRVK